VRKKVSKNMGEKKTTPQALEKGKDILGGREMATHNDDTKRS
jgi:hypothetical protein